MATPKPLDLTTAELRLGGYHLKQGKAPNAPSEIIFRNWIVVLADGTKYQFDYFRQKWQRWVVPSREAYRAAHWRNASTGHDKQLDAWLHVHPGYVPNTPKYKFKRGLANAPD